MLLVVRVMHVIPDRPSLDDPGPHVDRPKAGHCEGNEIIRVRVHDRPLTCFIAFTNIERHPNSSVAKAEGHQSRFAVHFRKRHELKRRVTDL